MSALAFSGTERGKAPSELQLWEVTGGAEKGGIVVRQGCSLTSPELSRLTTGAIVREAEIVGNRLRYRRLSGTGPDIGWVSLEISGKTLLRKTDERPKFSVVPAIVAPLTNRKLRILGLHGRVTNINILKFQLAPLKALLGKNVEWLYLEAPMAWDLPEYPDLAPSSPTELEQRLAGGKPLLRWFWIDNQSHDVTQHYAFVEKAVDQLKTFIKEQQPIDVIISFSQGSLITNILIAALQMGSLPISWRLNVFFCGGWIRDPNYTLVETCTLPTIQITGGKSDPYFIGGEPSLEPYFTNLLKIEHDDGHVFPTSQPRATEIMKQVAGEIKRTCAVE